MNLKPLALALPGELRDSICYCSHNSWPHTPSKPTGQRNRNGRHLHLFRQALALPTAFTDCRSAVLKSFFSASTAYRTVLARRFLSRATPLLVPRPSTHPIWTRNTYSVRRCLLIRITTVETKYPANWLKLRRRVSKSLLTQFTTLPGQRAPPYYPSLRCTTNYKSELT